MTYFDHYKKRLQVSGNGLGGAFKNSTVDVVNKTFADSPFYRKILVNDVEVEVRLITTKDLGERLILFRPSTTVDVGDRVNIDGESWLVFGFNDNEVYPKAIIRLTNDSLRWKDSEGTLHSQPCLATNEQYTKYEIEPNRYSVNLVRGGVYIYAPLNAETVSIKPSTRFIVGSQVYEVHGVDDMTYRYQGKGLVQVIVQFTTSNDKDDFVNGIADNSAMNGEPPTSGGGDLW